MPSTTSSSNYCSMESKKRVIGQYEEERDGKRYTVTIYRWPTSLGYAVQEVRTQLQLDLFDATNA